MPRRRLSRGRPKGVRGHGVRGIVPRQQVRAPVVAQVAPDAVDVVGAVLGVVVLDEERRAEDRVVVPLAGLGPAGPPEVHLVEPGLHRCVPRRRAAGSGGAAEVVPDEALERRLLVGAQVGVGDAAGDPRGVGDRVEAGDDVVRRLVGRDGEGPLGVVEAVEQRPRRRPPRWAAPAARRAGRCVTCAGSAPKKLGVTASSPPATVTCTARWWPLTRHAQAPSREGVPSTRNQNRWSCGSGVAPASSRRTRSSSTTARAVVAPVTLHPVSSRASAASRWRASISASASPSRGPGR